ncbi:MAG: response regulator transcription factor [Ktedonobacteraceae bacterium]|nr:response regulator transcription factor [Ktedonobacteraceae bacterium]
MNEQQQAIKQGINVQTQKLILVVDDDYHLRKMVQWTLEEEGFEVQTAGDGREAVERALLQQPALILLDMGLPLLDGSGVVAQVRTRYGKMVPIIIMSADGHVEEKSRQVEAVAYVRKPFDIDDLIHAVQHAFDIQ